MQLFNLSAFVLSSPAHITSLAYPLLSSNRFSGFKSR